MELTWFERQVSQLFYEQDFLHRQELLLRLQRVLLREEASRQADQQRDGIFAG